MQCALRHYQDHHHQATPHGINPALGGTVIISGFICPHLNGTFQVIPGSVTDAYTFAYGQLGLPDEIETNTSTRRRDSVQYGTPYYSFNTTILLPVRRLTRRPEPLARGLQRQPHQIGFIGTLDQTVSSLTLTAGSCLGCTPNPSGAPEINFRSVAFDPYTM